MPRNYFRRVNNGRVKNGRGMQRFSEAERLAYTLGLIERGKKNPDSKIYESYNRGLQGQVTRIDKPIA